jgi:hypothetical protein
VPRIAREVAENMAGNCLSRKPANAKAISKNKTKPKRIFFNS